MNAEDELPEGGDARNASGHESSHALERERLRAEAAERSSAEKSRLLGAVSHDLRTPLTTIMLRAELLEMGLPRGDAASAKEHARHIQEASEHMLYLVEQLQSFVRIESGRAAAWSQPADLAELCRGVARFVHPQAAQKGLALDVRVPEGAVPAVTDAVKVRLILLNLLSNAVRFTQRGGVGLRIRTRRDEAVFHVWDTGVGIPPEHLERIFEPFWHGADSSGSEFRGSGLGLPIARSLAELLGGRVRVRSRPGVGSCFSVRLPLGTGEGRRGE